MDKKISVLLVDDNIKIIQELSSYINAQSDMSIAGTACDGQEALIQIQKTKPDIVILDLIMPKLDGIGVVKQLNTMPIYKTPKIVLYSIFESGMKMVSSIHTNIEACLLKPQKSEYICDVIRSVIEKNKIGWDNIITDKCKDADLEEVVTQALIKIGIPAHLQGYQYCRSAIILSIKDTYLVDKITKDLYPGIAKLYKTTPSRVERAIRHAIITAWKRGNPQILNKYFEIGQGKPTNAEFIATVADLIRLSMK